MKLSDKQLNELLMNGYVKLPELRIDEKDIEDYSSFMNDKTYSADTAINKAWLNSFDFNSLKNQLADLARKELKKKIEPNDVYTVTRTLKSYDNLESYRGHFDSHIFTIVTPILMPATNTQESGQLLVFPRIRREPQNELINIIGKILYRIKFFGKRGFTRLMNKQKFIELDFNDRIPVLFLGRQCYHGNRGFEKAPNGTRLTLLTHLFDPSSKGIGAFLRKIRNR